jgi:deoxyribodipyrimidine photo-lyase
MCRLLDDCAQRGRDNHAVDVAVEAANALGLPLVVYFAAVSNFPHANLRHYTFLNQGLADIEEDLAARGIAFVMRRAPHESHERLFVDVGAAMVIGDENPMREPERWRRKLASRLKVPFWTVDADVLVPSKLIERAQYGACTIRPHVHRLLPEFLRPYKNPKADHEWKRPKLDGTSCLSPYLHFGHIGPLTIALAVEVAVKKDAKLQPAREAFFNELIVWRELAVNFVHHTERYDSPECAESWAKQTLAEHARRARASLQPGPA